MPERKFYAQVKKYCEIYVVALEMLILSVYNIKLLFRSAHWTDLLLVSTQVSHNDTLLQKGLFH